MGAAGSVVAEGIRAASPQKRPRAAANAAHPQNVLRSSVSNVGELRAALANWHSPAPEVELQRGTYTLRTAAAIEADFSVAEGALVSPVRLTAVHKPTPFRPCSHSARAAAEAQEAEAAADAAEKASQLELVAANMAAMEAAAAEARQVANIKREAATAAAAAKSTDGCGTLEIGRSVKLMAGGPGVRIIWVDVCPLCSARPCRAACPNNTVAKDAAATAAADDVDGGSSTAGKPAESPTPASRADSRAARRRGKKPPPVMIDISASSADDHVCLEGGFGPHASHCRRTRTRTHSILIPLDGCIDYARHRYRGAAGGGDNSAVERNATTRALRCSGLYSLYRRRRGLHSARYLGPRQVRYAAMPCRWCVSGGLA